MPRPINPLTLEAFASLTPVKSKKSYMGSEHFRILGDQLGLGTRVGALVFGKIVRPFHPIVNGSSRLSQGRAMEANEAIREFYAKHKIEIVSRDETKLPPIPKHLSRFESQRFDECAFSAKTLLTVEEHIYEFRSLAYAVGADINHGAVAIAGLVRSQIQASV